MTLMDFRCASDSVYHSSLRRILSRLEGSASFLLGSMYEIGSFL